MLKERTQTFFRHCFFWCLCSAIKPFMNLANADCVNNRTSHFNFESVGFARFAVMLAKDFYCEYRRLIQTTRLNFYSVADSGCVEVRDNACGHALENTNEIFGVVVFARACVHSNRVVIPVAGLVLA